MNNCYPNFLAAISPRNRLIIKVMVFSILKYSKRFIEDSNTKAKIKKLIANVFIINSTKANQNVKSKLGWFLRIEMIMLLDIKNTAKVNITTKNNCPCLNSSGDVHKVNGSFGNIDAVNIGYVR